VCAEGAACAHGRCGSLDFVRRYHYHFLICFKSVEVEMILVKNIHPVTDFTRKTKEYIRRLKKTGHPEVLTVNGEAQVVIQSTEAYQKLLDSAALAETLAGIQRGLEEADRGEVRPAREFLRELAAKHGVKLK
jgi:prevent-host-death family protein